MPGSLAVSLTCPAVGIFPAGPAEPGYRVEVGQHSPARGWTWTTIPSPAIILRPNEYRPGRCRTRYCKRVLAVLATAGLYEHSGQWLYDVGLPGKSGVAGGIVTVSPGKGGLGTFSPPLDAAGNSVRGQHITRYLSEALGLNLFASAPA
jgi:hypothetical protein